MSEHKAQETEYVRASSSSTQLQTSEIGCTEDTEEACNKLAQAAVRRIFDDASTVASTELWSSDAALQSSARDAQMRASTASYTSHVQASVPSDQ
jgi:hypothetical protein